jgi:hypothetical protein
MRTLGFRFLVLVVGTLYAGAHHTAVSQTISSANKPCLRDYAKYRKNPEHKAFVITVGNYRQQGCGMSWGYDTKKDAIGQAFKECAIAAARGKIPSKACRLMTAN